MGSLEAFGRAAVLVRAVHDDDLRRTALSVLERAGSEDPQILDLLFELLGDVDQEIVGTAIEILGRVGKLDASRSVRRLLALAGPGVPAERAQAIQAAVQAIRRPADAAEKAPAGG